ncbi:MAG: HpcH/HpaI aldolase/citrate lyase family protein [Gaiella sp.]
MSDIRDAVNPMPTLDTARSFLFAPGSDEEKLRKALATVADAVIADLEDAVHAERKTEARITVTRVFGSCADGGPLRLVRINGAGTEWFADDLALLHELPLDGFVLPKADPDALGAASAAPLPVIAIVETAVGLQASGETARRQGVAGLVLGAVDLGLDLGLEPLPGGEHLLFARSKLAMDSVAAGLRGPIDQVWVDTRDSEGLKADAFRARALGFRGKACIHPAQVEPINSVFRPSERELEQAQRVVAAYDAAEADGRGAVALDGELIDYPIVKRARQLLAAAERSDGG